MCRKTGGRCGGRGHSGCPRIHSEDCFPAMTFKSLARSFQASPAFIRARLGRESRRVGAETKVTTPLLCPHHAMTTDPFSFLKTQSVSLKLFCALTPGTPMKTSGALGKGFVLSPDTYGSTRGSQNAPFPKLDVCLRVWFRPGWTGAGSAPGPQRKGKSSPFSIDRETSKDKRLFWVLGLPRMTRHWTWPLETGQRVGEGRNTV